MSSISKMSISGIRSFSPQHDETIEFYAPLTMIVGANGCGKTTIIESLKFACSGSLPPNVKGGQSLINDPGMTDSTEVKAHVKLRFQNRSNRTCVAVRSLQVTRKKTKLEFKALEGVLRTTDDNDEKVSISMKCSDMDRILPENLGVSPAILENVIFVHQEDSNWPMQDSKTLKQRFDDVFESTRYTKALEALMKTRKEFQGKSKDMKVELAELNGHVMQANQFKIELEKLQEQEEEYHGKLTEIQERLKVTDGKLGQTSEIMAKVKTHHDDIKRTEWEIQDKKSRIQEKLTSIRELLDHQDDFTIQQALENFNMIMFTKQNELIKTTDQMRSIEKEIQVIRTNHIEPLQIKKGQAALLQKQVEENQGKQITLLNQYKKKYPQNTVLLNVTMVTKDNYRENMLEQMLSYLQRESLRVREEKEQELQQQKRQLQDFEQVVKQSGMNKQQLEIQQKMKQDEYRKLQQEYDGKRAEISKLNANRSNYLRLQDEFSTIKQQYNEFTDSYQSKLNDYKKQSKDVETRVRDLDSQIQEEQRLIQDLSSHKQEINGVDANIKQCESDLKQIQHELQSIVLMNPDLNVPALSSTSMNSASMGGNVTIFTSEIVQAIVEKQSSQLVLYRKQEQEFQVEYQQVTTEMTRNTITLQDCQQRMTVLQRQYSEYQVKQQQKIELIAQLNTIRQSAVLMESGFDQVSNNVTIEDLLQEMKTTEDEARELMIIEKAGKVFVKRFKKLRQQQPNQCPCCGQGMIDAAVVQYYEKKMQTIFDIDGGASAADAAATNKSKASAEEYKQILTKCGELSQQLQSFAMQFLPLQSSKQELEELQLKEQTIQQQSTYTLQPKLTSLENQLKNAKKQTHYHQDLSHQLKDFSTRSTNSWQRIQQLQEKKQTLVSQHMISYGTTGQNSMGGASSSSQWMMKSMEEMQRLFEEHGEERQFLTSKLQKLTTEEMNYTKRYTMQQQQYYEKERQVTTYEMEHQKLLESEKSIVVYQQHLQTMEQDLSTYTNELLVITNTWNIQTAQWKSQQDEVYRLERMVQEISSQRQQELLEVQNVWTTWKELQGKLGGSGSGSGKKNDYNYEEITTAIESYSKQIQEYEQEKGKIQEQIRKLQQELHSQETVKSNYTMNIELRTIRQEVIQLESKAVQLQQYLPSLPPSLYQYLPSSSTGNSSSTGSRKYTLEEMEKLSKKFLQEKQSIQSEYDMLKGRMEEMHRQVQEYTKKLQSPMFKKTQENYRKKTIEYETTLLAVADLDNYYTALDRALQTFHTMKIREINKIIRELWQLIYQGQDIDTIEIESGCDPLGGDMDGFAVPAPPSAASSSTASSRSYNYRVVMKKGDLPLDMRGRCSAGQKVLAAIVIRLALAETFCLNCGILALDEPTTNLDDANKAGLASALARLILARSKQQNFQLLCITHDEEFVQLMRQELSYSSDFNLPEFYFRIYRKEEGNTGKFFSHIERIPWEDM